MTVRFESQESLERETAVESRQRAVNMMDKMEDAGRAYQNPYANAIFRRFLIPLREFIEQAIKPTGKAGRAAAHVPLLRALNTGAVAYIAVRAALSSLMSNTEDSNDGRSIGRAIGKSVYGELVLATFEEVEHDLFWEIMHDFDRKKSKSESHRYYAMRHSALAKEVLIPVWTPGEREQVGTWLLEAMRQVGLIEIAHVSTVEPGRKTPKDKWLTAFTEPAMKLIGDIREVVELNMPYHVPFIEPPKDWTALNAGGYHTGEMRRTLPYCINMQRTGRRALVEEVKTTDLSNLFNTLNTLQRTRWQVNGWMLDTVRELSRHSVRLEEVQQQEALPKPPRPEGVSEDMKPADMSEQQLNEFHKWKKAMAEWHSQMKTRTSRWGRFSNATQMAARYRGYDAIYFLHQADFRGRMYAITTGISPQGSDLQKALIRFADGEPLDTPQAVDWFKIHGANKYGIDKVPFAERLKWVQDNDQFILQFAADPVSNRDWTNADSPLQFLAWCKEYAEWRADPVHFVSRLPVGFDGSCNGLQHFSGMLRDSVGGRATNLLDGERPNDIYGQVATLLQAKLSDLKTDSLSERDSSFRSRWLAHGINRSLVKRSVMTLPYGATRFSCAKFMNEDYLRHGKAPEFEKSEYRVASEWLSWLLWESISEVVIAAREAMDWLQACAGAILKKKRGEEPVTEIRWTSPAGFPVVQVYSASEVEAVRSLLLGGCRIKVGSYTDRPDVPDHKNGMAPNFVHSMDAAHLTFTTLKAKAEGITTLAMIHDDYGTHARHAQRLYEIIRETFVEMYETHDPIASFVARYDGLPPVPKTGELDVRDVLKSKFFFA